MTIKKFLAIWEVLQHFKSIFSTTLWMLIPGINLFIVLRYVGDELYNLPDQYYSKLVDNFRQALDPFTNTKQYWAKFGSESILSMGYAIAAFFANFYWVSLFFNKWPDYLSYAAPEWFSWAGYAVGVIVIAFSTRALFNMLHGIYKSHTMLHPEYAKIPLEARYLETRAKAIADRKKLAQVSY